MADKGSSTAKISLVANFEQNNIKAMGKQLSDGIKASLKDIKLDTVFDDANILDGVKKEIESIDGLLKNRTLNRLDFSSMIPPLAQALEDNSLSEQIRLQIVQGFREGLESGRTFLQGMPSGMTGDEIKAQFRQSAIMSDAIDSMPGLNKSTFKKMWKEITPQDIRQAMAMMDTYDNEEDLRKYMDYLTDAETAIQTILDNIGYETKGSSQKTAMAYGRLQYLAEEDGSGKIRKILERLNNSVVGPSKHTYKDENGEIKSREDRGYVGKQIKDVIQQMQIDDEGLSDLIEDVQLISSIRDDYFSRISESDATIENLLSKTLQRGYKNGSLQKMEPLYTGNYKTPAHITLSDLIEASNRETNTGGGEGAEDAAERAEDAAERAESASEEARAAVEDMKGTTEDSKPQASGASKKGATSKKKSSAQVSDETAEQIADDAEADAESAEHVADALNDKKARLESTIAELENKKKELQGLNDKYQKAISSTFGEVKTPEEALALFKEKAAQLQQANKDFAEIVPQRNFIEPKDAKEIAILEEYEKRLAALQQALVEYKKAGETAMDKGVNPADIRANQVDEERLQLNFADSTIDGYIKGLQKAIEDNKKKISEYENLLKTYRGQLEEFTRQGSPSDAKPSGEEQTQSRSAVDTAREEAGEVRKSREELQAEREKLEAEIQKSSQTMSEAEGKINQIDATISETKQNIEDNTMMRLPAVKAAEQSANQKKAKLEETKRQLEQIREEREQLEKELADIIEQENKAKLAQKRSDWYDDALYGQEDSLGDINIPFEFGKPQKKKAADQLRKFTRMLNEYDKRLQVPEEFRGDAEIEASYPDVIRYLHYRAFKEAEKHGVSKTTLDQNRLSFDHDEVAKMEKEMLEQRWASERDAYNEADEIVRQNAEKMNRLHQLQAKEKELQAAQPRQEQEYARAQHDIGGTQQVEEQIQRDKDKLVQLQQQRVEQQHIYDDAKKIQEESLQRQAEIDRMIAEADSREQQAPTTTQEKPSTPVSSGQAGEESPVVQNANQQLESLQNEEQQLTDKLAQITEEKNNIEKITQNINDILNKDVSVKTQKEAYNKAQFALIKASTVSAERFGDHAPTDKNSNEWKEWYERNKETIQQEKTAWLEYYKAMEEFESHGGETASKIANRRRLQPSDAVKHTREDWGFTSPEDLKQQLEADLQANKELLSSYEQQEQEIQNRIDSIQQQKEQLKASNAPLSSSGAETASGVQEEGNEAGDAASKMQALAQAKKEALEANKQLAESANTTQEAISAESSAGDFNTLILALTEIYELLSQLPQSFDGFKSFDLTGFTEPLNTLSQTIQQLPKEGFNISLGNGFDNLANSINEVLNKVQELTSEAKTAEIESNIAQKYDEQIKQLKADAEEAKHVIEELKRTKQDVVRDEYDPRLDSSSEQYAPKEVGREIATRTKRNPATDVDALIKEYGNLKRAQEQLFTISRTDEYSAALEKREEILQRILELEQKVALSDVGQAQIDNLLMGYGEDASSNFSALSEARNTAQKTSIGQLAKEYVDQQKAEIKALADSLSSIDIIPQEAQSNWSKSRKEEYNQIAEGAQAASQAIETLNANLAAMEANGASPEVLKTFLQLKESTAQMVKDTQDKSNVFGESIEAASTRLLDRLSNIETRLQVIKRDSGKLINVDPALAGALETIEKHLNKIQDLKNTVSNDPLQAINPEFTRSANSYLAQMEGKGKSKSVVEGLEQTSDRSQADFSRMTTNYGKYASALKKLFDDMSKGAGASLKNLEEDLVRVNELATRLAGSTGLERDNLLTGELNSKAAPKVAYAQAEAASKASIAYETMLTKIESKAESAQPKISSIFGEEGVTKGLESGFVEGTVKGFDEFVNSANQAEEALQHLQEIQNIIKDDKTWLTQKENITDYQQTMTELKSSLNEVAKKAGDFKIVDDLDVQKLRASTTQFIRDNPALSAEDISQLEGFIDQLQGKINSVDFKNLKKGIEEVKQQATEAGRTGDTFFSMLTQRFKSLGAYLLSFVSFYRVIGIFKDGINIIHELDDALTEMQKVSDESLSSLREYQKSTFDTANQIGTTAAQLQTSTADYMRLGQSLEEASKSAQAANVLFNVSEFDNVNDATTALIAMSAAYKDAANGIDSINIVDRLNLIGNNYAIATDELATALQDSASALTTSGNDLDQAIALVTSGNLVVQDAQKVGKIFVALDNYIG